jgi:hypothetical protein
LADAELCHLLTHSLAELKVPLRGIDLIQRAIRKIQLFDSQLTSIHADLCQLCLLAKCFKPALVFLNTDITSISQEVLRITLVSYCVVIIITIVDTLLAGYHQQQEKYCELNMTSFTLLCSTQVATLCPCCNVSPVFTIF